MLVSCVHPVDILRAVFCTICSLSMFVSDSRSILKYGSGYGFVCGEYGFFVFAPLGRGEDFEYVGGRLGSGSGTVLCLCVL